MTYSKTIAMGLLLAGSAAFAQTPLSAPGDAIQQAAAGNVAQPVGDSFITLFNAGYNGGTDPSGTITAQIYVFDAVDEQLVAICSCSLTPDAGAEISVKNNLINNTLTGAVPNSVTVKLVATKGPYAPGTNDATTDQRVTGAPGFSSGLRATRLTTHLAANYPGLASFATEVPFSYVAIDSSEYTRMVQLAGFIAQDGSGYGLCESTIGGSCSKGVSNAISGGHKAALHSKAIR